MYDSTDLLCYDFTIFKTTGMLLKQLKNSHYFSFILFSMLLISGCSISKETQVKKEAKQVKLTAAELFEHRIVTNESKIKKYAVSTPPYERIDFDQQFLVYLMAQRVTDARAKDSKTHYYIWIERTSGAWLDFTQAYSQELGRLEIQSHFANIRNGRFFKSYTLEIRPDQMKRLQEGSLKVQVTTKLGDQATITLPRTYVQAFLQIIKLPEFTETIVPVKAL